VRRPNPWIAVPTVLAAAAGGFIGFFVTNASCSPASCPAAASLVGLGVGLASAAGVGVVAVLALRSIAEWREHAEREITIVVEDDSNGGEAS
jgi:hypothetical protein